MTEVVTLEGLPFQPEKMGDKPTLKDPAKQLRKIADDIDAGTYGTIGTLALCMLGNEFYMFGGGESYTPGDVTMILEAGIIRLAKEVESHGL